MLQEQGLDRNRQIDCQQEIHFSDIQKPHLFSKESQLDFQKNYPKNIFIPMIEYLAEIGFKDEYEQCVGSRQQFEGKNVVSLSLIHKLMGAEWFRQNVQKRVLICNISNKILMNSKIKKKLFHLFVVKNLFDVYDQDLKEFKKRISKLANSISQQTYIEDQLFEYPSSILYLLRLFYKLISRYDISQESISRTQSFEDSPKGYEKKEKQLIQMQKTPSHASSYEQDNNDLSKISKQGSKQEYKFYIRKIIHHFNIELMNTQFIERFREVQNTILARQRQIIEKYKLPSDVPSWNIFIQKVVHRCFQCYNKSAKITHAMINEWIGEFKQHVTTTKGYIKEVDEATVMSKPVDKKHIPYKFKPLVLQYCPNSY